MNLLHLLFQRHRRAIGLACLLSAVSAAVSVMVLAFINERLLHTPPAMGTVLGAFAGLLLGLFVVATASQVVMTRLGHQLVYQLRRTLVKRLLDTPVERLEALGLARLLVSLQSDTDHITLACINLPAVLYGVTLSLGSFGYLAWLSLPLFLLTITWVAVAILVGWCLVQHTYKQVQLAREAEERLYGDYQAVIEGRKELTLNRGRAAMVYSEEFERHARQHRDCLIRGDITYAINDNWVNTMVLGAIGLTFVAAQHLGWADAGTAATYALIILFLRTPLTNVVGTLPSLVAGSVALAKVQALQLAEYQEAFHDAGDSLPIHWHVLHLEAVMYRYQQGNERFDLGPLDLAVQRGEVVFVIGGNGSGKSTFARLLSGLYQPHSGRIRLDDTVIDASNRAAFHRLFATVFSDFYLFTQLLGPGGNAAAEGEVRSWLARLGLLSNVTIAGHRLTDTRLSHGQRKRLALLLALLEQRPVLLLDEWAADQDPHFRREFYTTLLPVLKASGQTVIAITHDEAYFHLADRLLKMDAGRLQELHGTLWQRAAAETLRDSG